VTILTKIRRQHYEEYNMTLKWSPGFTTWSPSELGASLALWLDADDASTITLNGSAVSQWNDKSTNNRNAVQANATNQPIYTTSGLNNRPVITFDGFNDSLNISAFALGDMCIVFQRSANIQPVAEVAGGFRGLVGSSYPGFTTYLQYGVDGGALVSAAANTAVTTPRIVSGVTPQTGSAALSIGFGTPGYAFLNGFVAEFVSVPNLSTTNRQKIEGYLAWKWGLVASLPSNHPYKLIPPAPGS